MNKLIVISAPSGAGKTTLCAKLLQEIPELMLSISTTTRKPRGKEKQGIEYFFISEAEFKSLVAKKRFAEWAEVHGNFYGTTMDFVEAAFKNGKSLLLDIDVQGAESLRVVYPDQIVTIFIEPPSMAELENRLRKRGTEDEAAIAKRMKNAADEMARRMHFDHVIVNDDFDRAYFELSGIVLHALRGKQMA